MKRPLPTVLAVLLLFSSGLKECGEASYPRPEGYVRVDYPERSYVSYDEQQAYRFELPAYARVSPSHSKGAEPGWIDIQIPPLNATIHLSYKPVENNLTRFITDSRTLAYKHTVKAAGIDEKPFMDPENKRFGMVYELKGDVASALQFFVTDSTDHFLRGSLYFNCAPNRDSLNPVIGFLQEDIMHLINTLEWKY